MQLYLIRHTTPDIATGICYGQSDIDVAASFQEEFELLRSKLPVEANTAIYSSPLQRCLKLANRVADELNCAEIKLDPRLMELNFGEWEMQHWEDIPRGMIDVWGQDHLEQAPPQGESFQALHLRAKDFLEEVSTNNAINSAIVFTHAGVIRALLAEALQLPLMHAFRLQADYGSVTQIIVDGVVTRVGYVNR